MYHTLLLCFLCFSLLAKTDTLDSFDFVVVGSGAGSVVSAKLAEAFPMSSVLLIEAGPVAPDTEKVWDPATWLLVPEDENEIEWRYMSEPLSHLYNRTMELCRAKVLGGMVFWFCNGRLYCT